MKNVRTSRIFGTTAAVAAAALGLAACGGSGSESESNAGGATELVIAGTLPATTAMIQGAERIAAALADDAELGLTAEVYPDGQLGGEPAMLEALVTGTVDVAMVGAPLIATYCPQLGATSLPYVIQGDTPEEQQDNLQRIHESGVNEEAIEACAADEGYRVIADNWWYGNRHVTANTAIRTPDDMQGLRIRTPEGALHADPFAVLGAQPVPMPQAEVYTALETGVVDGQENPFATAYLHSFYDVQEYMNLTGLLTHTQVLVMSEAKYQSLTDEQREALDAAVNEAGVWQSAEQLVYNDEMRGLLEEVGMEIVEPDLDQFRAALEDFVQDYADQHEIDIDGIRAVQQ